MVLIFGNILFQDIMNIQIQVIIIVVTLLVMEEAHIILKKKVKIYLEIKKTMINSI